MAKTNITASIKIVTFHLVVLVFYVVALSLFSLFVPAKTKAQEPTLPVIADCSQGQVQYTALAQANPDSYDVYVRLGKREQTAAVSLYFQGFTTTNCQAIGQTQANGKTWIKLGSLALTQANALGTFTLASPTLQSLPNANRPTIMLVSQTHPICQPTDDCHVQIGGKDARLRASGAVLNADSLHVVIVKDPATDAVQQVDYYIDNKPAYSSNQLKSFDLRYVPSGEHKLATIITYASKQQAVIAQDVNRGYTDDLNYLIFTYITSRTNLWLIIVISLTALILADLIFSFIRHIHSRRIWKEAHGFTHGPVPQSDSMDAPARLNFQMHFFRFDQGVRSLIRRLPIIVAALFLVICMFILIGKWGVQFYTVDGPSMQSSYKSGDLVMVNKFGKTLSGVLNKDYVPNRGEVVVFKKVRDVSFEPIEAGQPTFVIKRIIGLPGERVIVKGSQITVINKEHPQGFNPDESKPWSKNLHKAEFDDVDVTLGADEVFVNGDNRSDSIDSRTYGAVKLHEIVGSAVFALK